MKDRTFTKRMGPFPLSCCNLKCCICSKNEMCYYVGPPSNIGEYLVCGEECYDILLAKPLPT